MTRMLAILRTAMLLIVALGMAGPARAALVDLGTPVAPHGYPWFYADSNGLRLQLCLDGDGVNGMCIFDPVDPDNPDSVLLQVGDESFWWLAEAEARPLVSKGKALLTMALEGAFGGTGVARNGEQIAFARIRLRVDVAEAGSYRILYPFGELIYNNVTVADGINSTEDIGAINFLSPAAGFAGALEGKVGPFLTWPDYANALLNPGLQLRDPVSGALLAQYVGDPNVPHQVVGSAIPDASHPSGFRNAFRIQKQQGDAWVTLAETDLFTVMGKALPAGAVEPAAHEYPPLPPSNLFAVGPVNREAPWRTPSEGTVTGVAHEGYPVGFPLWYQERVQAEDPLNPGTLVDQGGVRLTICPGSDPMCISDPINPANPQSVALNVGDEAFWWAADAAINAREAGEGRVVGSAPAGLDGLLVLGLEGAFDGAGVAAEGKQIAFARVRIRVNVPTAGDYTVTHPYGQITFKNVTVADGINYVEDIGIINPADPDGAFVGAMYGKVNPFLTWPDFAADPALQKPLDPNDLLSPPVQYVGDPAIPHLVTGSPLADAAHPSGFRNYFRIQGPGINVRTDYFLVQGKVFDPATFQVIPDPNAPVARNDAATTEAGVPVTVAILANDTVAGSPVDPATTTVTLLPAGEVTGPFDGTAQLNPDKTVTYTPAAGFTGSDSFAYQITVGGLVSNPATASVQVLPVETIGVSRAQLDLRKLQWNIQGTSTLDGSTLTLYAGPTAGDPTRVIGSAAVSRGRWQYRGTTTSNPGVTSISIVSSTGKTLLNQPLRVR